MTHLERLAEGDTHVIDLPSTINNFIGGRDVPPANGAYIDLFDPARGEIYARLADSGPEDVARAVDSSQAAFDGWASTPAWERSRVLLRIAKLIAENAKGLAEAESIDSGKPVSLATSVDIPRARSNFEFFATAILHESQRAWSTDSRALNYELRRPLGVVGCISPWNLPLYLLTWKVAPALAAGNCVVAKPSEVTPLTARVLADLTLEAGLPAGVLNIVNGPGSGAGSAIVEHPRIEAISFTGGTETGRMIAGAAAPVFKKLTLELGGKNPNIVFADCDYEKMLETTVRSSFSNQGQICLCGSRILVEESIYDRFVGDLTDRAQTLRIGDPLEQSTDHGAVVSEQHFEKVMAHIRGAADDGGSIVSGGESVVVEGRCENGWFIAPTIITGLDPSCAANQEEIFGPVVTVSSFQSELEALDVANDTDYGLSASIWTGDVTRAHRMADGIEAGVVWVNTWMLRDLRTPFGGTKASGIGREGGFEALDFFRSQKSVTVEL